MQAWLSYEASAGASEGDPDVQSIVCILGIQRAFLWYGNVHVVSNARVEQMIAGMWRKHEALACPFWKEGRLERYSGWSTEAAGCCLGVVLKQWNPSVIVESKKSQDGAIDGGTATYRNHPQLLHL